MGALPSGGAMMAVEISEQVALEALDGYEERVSLAAVNGSSSVVISGDEDAVLELAILWGEKGAKTKRLRVSHAFHSHRMDAMLGQFTEVAASIALAKPRIPLVSNVTGRLVSDELCSAEYWAAMHVTRFVSWMVFDSWRASACARIWSWVRKVC